MVTCFLNAILSYINIGEMPRSVIITYIIRKDKDSLFNLFQFIEKIMKRKITFIAVTLIIMLITSRFMIRIIDATVQIDDDITLLLLLLATMNAVIGVCSYILYRKHF